MRYILPIVVIIMIAIAAIIIPSKQPFDCSEEIASEPEIVRVMKQDGWNCFIYKDNKFYPVEGGCE